MALGSRERASLGGRRVLGVVTALHAGGWSIAAGPAWAGDLDACVPQVVARASALAAAGAELTLAGGAIVTSPALRFAPGQGLDDAAGRPVEIRSASPPDRWGRIHAAAILITDRDPPDWLEAQLVEAGRAMVAARPGGTCSRALLAREAAARAAGRGLWADPANRPLAAGDLAALLAREGRFAIVEGRISAVGERHGTVYVNFGRRWSEDFTIRVASRDRRAFIRAGLDLERMAGRTVRVRGHIERRGGPAITAVLPEQIELLEANR